MTDKLSSGRRPAQPDFGAFPRGFHFQLAAALHHQEARALQHFVDLVVVVRGIVVKQNSFFARASSASETTRLKAPCPQPMCSWYFSSVYCASRIRTSVSFKNSTSLDRWTAAWARARCGWVPSRAASFSFNGSNGSLSGRNAIEPSLVKSR